MPKSDSDVLIYAPFKKEGLSDNEIKWLDSFQSILMLSLKQITKANVNFESSFQNPAALEGKSKVLIPLLINASFDIEEFNKNKFSGEKIIQVNGNPDINVEISEECNIIKLFDETKNKTVDLSGHIAELKNEVWLKFLDIAYEIRSVFDSESASHTNKGKIFVAETSPEQNTNRDTIIRELEHLGYQVLPEKNFPRNMITFSEMVQENMRDCFLSIHIIGNYYAPLLENIEISSIELQNDLFHEVAAELNAKNQVMKRLVWIPPDLKPKSEKQKLYIESFKRNIELLKNTEIIQTPIEVFKSIIEEKATTILEAREVINEVKEGLNSVYFISNNKNSEMYSQVKKMFEKGKIKVLEEADSSNKIDLIQNHYYNLINCDGILIDYSTENYQWLNSKLSDILKSPGFGRKRDFLAKAVLINTSESPNISIKINNLELIKNSKKGIDQRLSSFIEKIIKK